MTRTELIDAIREQLVCVEELAGRGLMDLYFSCRERLETLHDEVEDGDGVTNAQRAEYRDLARAIADRTES